MSGIYLFDINQKLINTIEEKRLIDPYQELELNALIKAEFTCKYDKEVEQAYYFGFKDDDNFHLNSVRNILKKDGFITEQGVHIMFDELKGKVVRDLRMLNKTPGYALGKALDETGWTCISHVDNIASTNFYYISALDALYKICNIWKVEFKPVIRFIDGKISAKEIHLYQSLGSDLGRVFSYRNKLVSVLAETNKDNLYTAFIGRGKGEEIVDKKGKSTGGYGRKIKFTDIDYVAEKDGIKVHSPKGIDYIEIEEATKVYGYPDGTPRIRTVDFDDIEDKEELAKATFDFALENSRPKMQLKASGLEIEQVGLGETVTVIADMGIRFKTRVFKIKKNILSKSVVSFEFGDKIIKTTADRLKASQTEKNNDAVKQLDYMEQVLRAIESTYYNEDGYQYDLKADNEYNLPAGIYSFDRPIDQNPTKVIYLGAGKLMIADSKKEDGSWRFRTAIDGKSVNADTIRTGILEGGRVFWNLNDGTFRIGESKEKFSMLWDGGTLKLRNIDIDLSNNSQINNIENSIINQARSIGDINLKLGNQNKEIISMKSDLKINLEGIKTSFEKRVKGIEDDVTIRDGNIRSYVENNYSTKTQTADLIESKVSSINARLGSAESRISQTSTEISKTVKKNGVISAINQSAESLKIKASKIDLQGDVSLKGRFTTYKSNYKSLDMNNSSIYMYDPNNNHNLMGSVEASSTLTVKGSYAYNYPVVKMSHASNGLMIFNKGINSDDENNYYILLDKEEHVAFHDNNPIVLYQNTLVRGDLTVIEGFDNNRQSGVTGRINIAGWVLEATDAFGNNYIRLKNRGEDRVVVRYNERAARTQIVVNDRVIHQ